MPASRRFNLDGIVVDVRIESPVLAPVVESLLSGCSQRAAFPSEASSGTITITLGVGPRPKSPSERPRFAFPPLRAYVRDSGWLLLDDVGHLEVSPTTGVVTGAVEADADLRGHARFAMVSLWVALLECLRARGRYLMHAAGVVDPEGDLVLLIGPSGVGKSTATVSLLEEGWIALSDDLLFLEIDSNGNLSTVAHRRQFHVDDTLVGRHPHLRRFVRERPDYEPCDKKLLDVELAFPRQITRRWGAPTRIYFPELGDHSRSIAVPIRGREALLRTFPHSCFVGVKPDLAPGHLHALSTMVNGAAAARLYCGVDLLAKTGHYSRLLGGELCRSSASA